ncbi:hypothetical protein MgSA37_03419 [Mucilaginibacter gotjawali]|uniref:Uncharacterized protein n=1 Tax=Mucilaginibacter gotjawali TaxID=1550579 RepID=A0A110B3A7_9SPHI|nr:hypothetical protein MgSA37_03419 [Mucilaginibacter gotjawali]
MFYSNPIKHNHAKLTINAVFIMKSNTYKLTKQNKTVDLFHTLRGTATIIEISLLIDFPKILNYDWPSVRERFREANI